MSDEHREPELTTIPSEVDGDSRGRPTLVTPQLLREWALPVPAGSKYSRGDVLVIGGAARTPGAVILAGRAALRMGAGRLTLALAESVAPSVGVVFPESGATGLPQDANGSVSGENAGAILERDLSRADAVLVGPGLDEPEGARRLLDEIIANAPDDVPFVLDALGLTVLPDLPRERIDALRGRMVATPNFVELARLVGEEELADDQVTEAVQDAVAQFGCVVGCNAVIAGDGGLWEITTGDAGLGTSGSGDVVAGAVAGLLGRGAGLAQAVVWAKHVHATAGETLSMEYGRVGYLAGELCDALPMVLRSLGGD